MNGAICADLMAIAYKFVFPKPWNLYTIFTKRYTEIKQTLAIGGLVHVFTHIQSGTYVARTKSFTYIATTLKIIEKI